MAHLPINHPLRPLYRTLAALAGLYVLVFGIVGLSRSSGRPFFGHDHVTALGLRTNPAFAILSIVVGVVVLAAVVYGRNADHFVNMAGGLVFLLAGMAMLALLRTTANFLNFSMSTCIVSFVIGTVMLTAGLYSRTGPPEEAAAEERDRRGALKTA
ncbi:MAG TPA: DUF4383 domain-containing protein [Rugosimonospora sp.]|nr:DUF4383 domain-containing protein [Rugosimonospora sp.]